MPQNKTFNPGKDQFSGDNEYELLIKNIVVTLTQREDNNFLIHCRRTTEGIVMMLAKLSEIDEDAEPEYMLGSVLRNNDLTDKIGIDYNIKADLSYIRMVGNRASHYQRYDSGSTGEVNAAKEAFTNIVEFFFAKTSSEIPSGIRKYLYEKNDINKNLNLHKYNLDKALYSDVLYAIETSADDYPRKGKTLLSNICSKVIIDAQGSIPDRLLFKDSTLLDIKKAIDFIAQRKLLSKDFISDLNAANDYFSSASISQKHEHKLPNATENTNLLEIVKRITDSFFFKRYSELQDQAINAKLFFVNLFSVFMGLASVIALFYGAIRQGIPFNFYNHPVIVSTFLLAVGIYVISFSYELFYSALPSIRNKKIYSVTSAIKDYGNIIIVGSLFLVFNYYLHDGKKDIPFLPFYVTTITWLVSLQISTIVSDRKGVHDRFMKYVAYVMLAFIGYMTYLVVANYG